MAIEIPYNDFVKKQNNKNLPLVIRRGIINKVYPESWTADVQVIGSVQTILKSVPISLAMGATDVQVGDKCKLDLFDEGNQIDIVVSYTYGRNRYRKFNSGSATLTPSTLTIPHGLSRAPDIVSISSPFFNNSAGLFYVSGVDDTYIHFIATGAPGTQSTWNWWAALVE